MDRAVYGTQQIVSDRVAKFVPPNINLFIVYEEPITAWQCAGFAEQKKNKKLLFSGYTLCQLV